MVVSLLVVACAVTVVASFLRRPARRDLRWLSGGLVVGVIGEAVLGAVVVYTKLNAYVVMTHFMVGMALLTVAVVLTLAGRARGPGAGTLAVEPAVPCALDPGCCSACSWWCWPPAPPPPGPAPTPAGRGPSGSRSASRT